MSHALIARNDDLRSLQEAGYTLRIVDAQLLVENVPYVTPGKEVQEGILAMELDLSANNTVPPTSHVAYWIGDLPSTDDGKALVSLIHENAERTKVAEGLPGAYTLSAKPDTPYRDYRHKAETYIGILGDQARRIRPDATAQQWKRPTTCDDEDDVFRFPDTAASRHRIADLRALFRDQKVAIVGLGGTGSYVLDFVAKTPVHEIHVFDGKRFLDHNAYRAPGAYGLADLEGGPFKTEIHASRYRLMRRRVVSHSTRIGQHNLGALDGFTTVFLCMDGHRVKRQILQTCLDSNTLVIDAGMGLYRVDTAGSIAGIVRTTMCDPERRDYVEDYIPLDGVDDDNEYDRNIQIAEVNALNAALAVIKWKKEIGFYNDLEREVNCEYIIDGNRLINSGPTGKNEDPAHSS